MVPIYLGPAAIGLGAVLAFWAALGLVWWKPVPPEVDVPPASDIDLTPGRLVKVWGVLIVAAVGVLYCLFF